MAHVVRGAKYRLDQGVIIAVSYLGGLWLCLLSVMSSVIVPMSSINVANGFFVHWHPVGRRWFAVVSGIALDR